MNCDHDENVLIVANSSLHTPVLSMTQRARKDGDMRIASCQSSERIWWNIVQISSKFQQKKNHTLKND
jgi:hypothetical protein